MDDRSSALNSVTDGVFHKEKEAKRKTIDKKSIDNTKGSTHISNVNSLNRHIKRHKSIASREVTSAQRRAAAIRNHEIDEFLKTLVMEGIVDDHYTAWAAKCIHTLGLLEVNSIVIKARTGSNPQKLLSFLLNGALQSHHKSNFYKLETY